MFWGLKQSSDDYKMPFPALKITVFISPNSVLPSFLFTVVYDDWESLMPGFGACT